MALRIQQENQPLCLIEQADDLPTAACLRLPGSGFLLSIQGSLYSEVPSPRNLLNPEVSNDVRLKATQETW